MNITGFVDVDIKNRDAVSEFMDLNVLAHETIFNTLLTNGVSVEHYPLWTEGEMNNDWLQVHGAEHRAWSSVLSLSNPPDIDSVDVADPAQMADWLAAHALHHQIVNEALGLT